jgi:Holliday junction resolvase RusA-like endonuclease
VVDLLNPIKLTIYMEPVAKGRPRVVHTNGRTMTFTPDKTTAAEHTIKAELLTVRQQFPAGVPLYLTANFFRSRPKSLPKRVTRPVTKPDWDNYAKLLGDSLNRFIYPDDGQVVSATIKKFYAAQGEYPRIEFEVGEEQ